MAICAAIEDRAEIRFSYDGGTRTVEPHCHGTSRTGKEVLRGYQTGGFSKSGPGAGWRLFEVRKIVSLRQTGGIFPSNRTDYNPNDNSMRSVHCHV